jgi:hypothetical protein
VTTHEVRQPSASDSGAINDESGQGQLTVDKGSDSLVSDVCGAEVEESERKWRWVKLVEEGVGTRVEGGKPPVHKMKQSLVGDFGATEDQGGERKLAEAQHSHVGDLSVAKVEGSERKQTKGLQSGIRDVGAVSEFERSQVEHFETSQPHIGDVAEATQPTDLGFAPSEEGQPVVVCIAKVVSTAPGGRSLRGQHEILAGESCRDTIFYIEEAECVCENLKGWQLQKRGFPGG